MGYSFYDLITQWKCLQDSFINLKTQKQCKHKNPKYSSRKTSQEGLTYKFYCMPLFEASLTNQNIGITECNFVNLTRPHHLQPRLGFISQSEDIRKTSKCIYRKYKLMNLKINFLENIQNIKSSTSDELLINIGHSIPAHIICKINKILRNNLFEQK